MDVSGYLTKEKDNFDVLPKTIKVLLIGNNPLEMSSVYQKMKSLRDKRYITDFCFDVKDSLSKILKFDATCILVDDTLHIHQLKKLIGLINNNFSTRHIPITLLKSNYRSEVFSAGIQDFILKDNLTTEALSKAILNAIKFRKTRSYLFQSYKFGKKNFKYMFLTLKTYLGSWFLSKKTAR